MLAFSILTAVPRHTPRATNGIVLPATVTTYTREGTVPYVIQSRRSQPFFKSDATFSPTPTYTTLHYPNTRTSLITDDIIAAANTKGNFSSCSNRSSIIMIQSSTHLS